MKVSAAGIVAIKSHEGCRLEAYQDVAGVWTVGYGHTPAQPKQKITQAEADALLAKDLGRFEQGVLIAVKAPMSQAQFDAFVCLAFNIGVAAFAASTAARRFKAGDLVGCCAGWALWCKAGGEYQPALAARRGAEICRFMGGT